MAKGKSSNPADAYRKAQRAKELKKESMFSIFTGSNKENRAKTRETATLKKDTSGLEKEIHELEDIGEGKLSSAQKERLKELRAEVARVRKVKQDYVAANPEQSHLAAPAVRAIFGKNGLPLHPERSIYYDPVLNPYGMPPPGMPYAERALLPHEIEQDDEQGASGDDASDEDSKMDSADGGSDEESDDDDIVLPPGPPPSGTNQDSESGSEDSDDDIPMPPGPPPPKSAPLPKGPPPPPFLQTTPYGAAFPPFPPNASPYAQAHPYAPPPPPGFPTVAYSTHTPPFAQPVPYPQQMVGREPRPHDRQFAEAVRVVQDPLSNVPHVTYQAHQAQRHQPPLAGVGSSTALQHGLPPKPGGAPQAAAASATISAEPELRDLKKEATAFVPTSMRRATKKGPNTNATSSLQINAAPNEGDDQSGPSAEPRKDLMSVLGNQLGVTDKSAPSSNTKPNQGKDDYDKFLAEVGSFL